MLKWFISLYGLLSGFMIIGLSRLRRKGKWKKPDDLPTIAVVVAARNESENLPKLINALRAQNYLTNKVSFWIVDDDSDDETYLLGQEAEEKDNRFHALRSDISTPIASPKKRALDTAIRLADAEWIVTTDADCVPGPDWLAALSYFMEKQVGAIVGYAPLDGGHDPLEWMAEGESWSAAALAAAGIGLGFPFNAMGRNFAFRRKVYLDLGGYGFGGKMASGDDDLFLQYIAARTNWKVEYALDPSAKVISQVASRGKILGTKARHLSVGPKYAPGWVIIGAVGSSLFMGLGLVTLAGRLFKIDNMQIRKAWVTKWIFDVLMVIAGLRILGDPTRAIKAIAAMSAAPFALWAIWPKALIGTTEWKGRKFEGGRVPEEPNG